MFDYFSTLPLKFWLIVFLLSSREDICKDTSCHTLGMAKMGQLCDVVDSCAIVEDNGLGTPYSIAHEIGHM